MPERTKGGTRRLSLTFLVAVLAVATWIALNPRSVEAGDGSDSAPDPALPQAILAFVDTDGNDLPPSTVLTPGTTLRVRVGLTDVPDVNTEATAYLVRVKLLVERDILSRTETFSEGRRPVYSNGRQTPQFVDLFVPTVDDGSQPAVAVVVMYDADGPGSAAGPIQLVGSFFIRIQRTAVAIAERYAPTLKFNDGEKYFPVEVEAMLENADLKYRKTEWGIIAFESDDVLAEKPVKPETLRNLSLEYGDSVMNQTYLELNIDNGDHDAWWVETEDQQGAQARYKKVVYARVVPVEHSEEGELTAIQYWMFYVYNSAANKHEGDWEGIQLIFRGRDAMVLIDAISPLWLDYAAHGTVTRWSDCSLGKSERPVVYVARHSHASYLNPGVKDREGKPDDDAEGNGNEWEFEDVERSTNESRETYELRLMENQLWLDWPGRWGDWKRDLGLGLIGPRGPKFKNKEWDWDNPLVTGDEVQEAQCEYVLPEENGALGNE